MRGDEAQRDTIAAVATPAGRGGIGVVRVSGPDVRHIAKALLGELPPPRHARYLTFHSVRGEAVDRGIALFFPTPHSYTGEDTLELQGHGGPLVVQEVLSACLDAGARLAQPGEFTRRAFLEGRIDLAQAEAVADLIDAASREAARSAMRSLSGEFSAAIDGLRTEIVELRALTEAMLDFPEEDVDALHRDDALARLARLRTALQETLAKSRQGGLLRRGLHVVLAGPPNVGKSSLLNCLAGEDRAIVTPIPGTTRDALREPVQIEGVPLTLVDTAGLRAAGDRIERLGMERTQREVASADIVLIVAEATTAPTPVEGVPADAVRLVVYNKVDLHPAFTAPAGALAVSARTGKGLEALRKAIVHAAGWSSAGESVFLARERHVRALGACEQHLARAACVTDRWELFAEELRLAHDQLSGILGSYTSDDLLGEIFSRFCIGK
jgi:tRNA modification GTPase